MRRAWETSRQSLRHFMPATVGSAFWAGQKAGSPAHASEMFQLHACSWQHSTGSTCCAPAVPFPVQCAVADAQCMQGGIILLYSSQMLTFGACRSCQRRVRSPWRKARCRRSPRHAPPAPFHGLARRLHQPATTATRSQPPLTGIWTEDVAPAASLSTELLTPRPTCAEQTQGSLAGTAALVAPPCGASSRRAAAGKRGALAAMGLGAHMMQMDPCRTGHWAGAHLLEAIPGPLGLTWAWLGCKWE